MAFLHRNHTSFCLGKNENRCTVQSLETGTTFSKASYLTSAILESSSQMPTQNLKKSAFFSGLLKAPKSCLVQLRPVTHSPLVASAQPPCSNWQSCVVSQNPSVFSLLQDEPGSLHSYQNNSTFLLLLFLLLTYRKFHRSHPSKWHSALAHQYF